MEQKYQERIAIVQMMLYELGSAYRGSWHDFDGRTLRSQLDDIAVYLNVDCDISIHDFRGSCDLCPAGNGHWTEFCDEYCIGG